MSTSSPLILLGLLNASKVDVVERNKGQMWESNGSSISLIVTEFSMVSMHQAESLLTMFHMTPLFL